MDKHHQLQSYFKTLDVDEAFIKDMESIVLYKYYQAGDSILEAGEKTNYMCLVMEGIVRGYYLDQDGNDITKCFSKENDWCCSYSYLTNEPSPFYLEALENTTLARFDLEKIKNVLQDYPQIYGTIDRQLHQILVKSERRVFSFAGMEAKDRYLSMVKESPDLVKRVKQEYIASYLGITPSSLSRIKKSL